MSGHFKGTISSILLIILCLVCLFSVPSAISVCIAFAGEAEENITEELSGDEQETTVNADTNVAASEQSSIDGDIDADNEGDDSVDVNGQASSDADSQSWPEVPEIDGEAIILMEANTDAVIYEKNQDDKMYPASTTKILTAIIVLENCSLDETVTFTEEAVDLEDGAVTIDSVVGEEMSLKDVMYGLLLPSGNDCAIALAIHVAGSVDAFADMMNAKAKEIGATSSHFTNPSGLYDSDHYVTASDLALIAQYAFRNSTFVDIISHATYIIEPTNMTSESRVLTNTHEMIIPGNSYYSSDVIGGKTGYLYESGRCLVTYAEKDGITLLAIILDGDYYGIFSATQELLDYGWDNFEIINVSETERRFSYAAEDAKVQMDSSSQILTLKNVAFEDLTSSINYAYYLNDAEYAAAKEEAGITDDDNRQLYAWIDYSYAGYYLGRCNIYIDPDLSIQTVSFSDVIYINVWLVVLVVILVLFAVLMVVLLVKRASERSVKNAGRRSRRRKTRYYNRSDSVDLRNQYIRNGDWNRKSIHALDDIGIDNSQDYSTHARARANGSQGYSMHTQVKTDVSEDYSMRVRVKANGSRSGKSNQNSKYSRFYDFPGRVEQDKARHARKKQTGKTKNT